MTNTCLSYEARKRRIRAVEGLVLSRSRKTAVVHTHDLPEVTQPEIDGLFDKTFDAGQRSLAA